MVEIESEEELDPGVPFPHGDDYDQEEIDTWPDFEPWHPSWVGLSPAATRSSQIPQKDRPSFGNLRLPRQQSTEQIALVLSFTALYSAATSSDPSEGMQ